MRPDVVIERELALRSGGAMSATSGSMSCGVTVVAPTMKERPRKAWKEFVRHRPSHWRC